MPGMPEMGKVYGISGIFYGSGMDVGGFRYRHWRYFSKIVAGTPQPRLAETIVKSKPNIKEKLKMRISRSHGFKKCEYCGGKGYFIVRNILLENYYGEGYRSIAVPASIIFSAEKFLGDEEFITASEHMLAFCPHCLATGKLSWIDEIIRPGGRDYENTKLDDFLEAQERICRKAQKIIKTIPFKEIRGVDSIHNTLEAFEMLKKKR